MYRINYADGRNSEHATYDAATAEIEATYPEAEIGHDGDLTGGGERTLCWGTEEDSENDDGANAVADITAVCDECGRIMTGAEHSRSCRENENEDGNSEWCEDCRAEKRAESEEVSE